MNLCCINTVADFQRTPGGTLRLVVINLAASGSGGGGGTRRRWLAYYIIIAIIPSALVGLA